MVPFPFSGKRKEGEGSGDFRGGKEMKEKRGKEIVDRGIGDGKRI